ncbi:MAG: hypothetical protein IJZ36_03970 [Bacilli bacterium]|nr:hypothetical protein [Bacilli bacterium]
MHDNTKQISSYEYNAQIRKGMELDKYVVSLLTDIDKILEEQRGYKNDKNNL